MKTLFATRPTVNSNPSSPWTATAEQPERTRTRAALTELLQLLDKQAGTGGARIEEVRGRLRDDVRELSTGDPK